MPVSLHRCLPKPNNLASPLVLALALDWFIGEPPNQVHPVVWLGTLVDALDKHAPRKHTGAQLLYGAGITATGVVVAVVWGLVLERGMAWLERRGQRVLSILGLALALKMTFAWRALIQAGGRVQHELEANRSDGARRALRSLVSRDTTRLDPPLLAAAAIESLAENASDSVVAPLLYYQVFGLPGACAYRAINTMDAMLGYRGRYEYLGKASARLDDLVNWLPARLTGLAIVLVAWIQGDSARTAWRVMQRDHRCTDSPNAGYPMSALAGALDVRLEKAGHYCLHAEGHLPTPADIGRASRVITLALALVLALGALIAQARRMP